MTVASASAVPMLDPLFIRSAPRPVIESPCNRVCTLDPVSGLCLGCGRSLAEIARWPHMSDAERKCLLAALDERARRSTVA